MRLEIDGNAWNRGFWDGELGLPLRSCTYAVGTTERWSWSSGYIEGNAFRKGFKATLPCSPMRPRKDAPAAEAGAVALRSTPPASAAEETKEKGVNIACRSGVKVRRRLTDIRDFHAAHRHLGQGLTAHHGFRQLRDRLDLAAQAAIGDGAIGQ